MRMLHWTPALDRKQLTDALSSGDAIRYPNGIPLENVPEPAAGEVRLGRWGDELTSDQWDVVFVRSGEQRDFLAWIATYFPKTAPITQWCRVIERADLPLLTRKVPASMSSWTGYLWANVVLGECYAQMRDPISLGTVSTHAALSCETFVAARTRAVGEIGESGDRIATRWSDVLHAAGQMRRLPRERLRRIWQVVDTISVGASQLSGAGSIGLALAEIVGSGELSENGWSELGHGVGVPNLTMPRGGTQEERLRAYDKLIASLPQTDAHDAIPFVIGCAASTVGNGKLDYLDLLKPILDRYPASPLWFALHAALIGKNATGAEFGGFGRRIAREILAPGHPDELSQADISAQEVLMILSTGPAALQAVRGFTKAALLVEIAPFITAVLPVTQRDREHPSSLDQGLRTSPAPSPHGTEKKAELASEADRLLQLAINSLHQLRSELRSNARTAAKQVSHEPPNEPLPQTDELSLSKTRSRSKKPKAIKRGLFG